MLDAPRPQRALRARGCLLARAASLDPARPSTLVMRRALGFHGAGKGYMLRIYPVILGVLKELQPLVRRIELRDRDLGRQLRRCSSSIALNVAGAEGRGSRGGTDPLLHRRINTLIT